MKPLLTLLSALLVSEGKTTNAPAAVPPAPDPVGEQPQIQTAYDPVNGVRQELVVTSSQDGALLKGVLVCDSPLIIRLAGQASPAAPSR